MIKVLLEAPIYTQSGYGEHSRLVYRSLIKNTNLDIYINPLNWGKTSWSADLSKEEKKAVDICVRKLGHVIEQQNSGIQTNFDLQVHVGIPNEFQKKGTYSVCVTAGIETDRVSDNWLSKTYQGLDKIIVPSEHAKLGFVGTAYEVINKENNTKTLLECNCDVDVVPYPVKNTEIESMDFTLDTKFNFLMVGLLGVRKNIEKTIEWFLDEFENEDVGLVIKTAISGGSNLDKRNTKLSLRRLMGNKKRKCKVYLLHGSLSEAQVHSLYKREDIHCYVAPTAGEGFGLPIFEAAYSDLPIIATDWSAHPEYLVAPYKENGKVKNKKLFGKIDYDLKEIPKSAVWKDILIEGSRWAYPKQSSFKKQIRNVYKNYGMYKKWATILGKQIRKNYTFDIVSSKMSEAILKKSGLYIDPSTVVDLKKLKNEALQIKDVKERSKFAKQVMEKDLSQIQKLDFLKGLYKGERAVMLSCGPTLTDHDPQKIRDLLKNSLGVAVKQSFQMFEELIDLHLYNCGNFKNYDYSNSSPIVIEASTSPSRLGQCDIKFFIRERDFNNSVASKKDFDSWTFEKQPLLRPYGPGIMYEVVFYALHHLGVSEIITIGWDNKHIEGNMAQQHFYDKIDSGLNKEDFIDSNEVAANQAAVTTLSTEGEVSTAAILDWANWLSENGTKLKIVSSINPAPESIERLSL